MSPAERFAMIIQGLWEVVAAQSIGKRMPDGLIHLLWTRLRRLGQRFAKVVAQLEAGTLRPPGPLRSRPGRARPDRPPPELRVPNGFGWLVWRIGWQAAGRGSQLEYLLRDPEMQALLAAAPQLAAMLRPLCRMLAIKTAGLLPPPVKRRRAADQVQDSTPPARTAKTGKPRANTPPAQARQAATPEPSPDAARAPGRHVCAPPPAVRFSRA